MPEDEIDGEVLPTHARPRARPQDRLDKKVVGITKQRSVLFTWAVLGAIIVLYGSGLALITRKGILLPLGCTLLAEAMVLSWYMGHEAAHCLAFSRKRSNMVLGEAMSWLTGTLYFPFEDYRSAHIRHHVDKVDIIGVSVNKLINGQSVVGRSILLASEWAYFPMVYFIVKAQGVGEQIRTEGEARRRALIGIVLYCAFFAALAWMSTLAPLWLLLAVIIRVHVIRFVDAFQHTYEQIPSEQQVEKRNRHFEQLNTYSYPVFRRVSVLNLLILNFGFHNAHHAVPGCPWYRLPAVDERLTKLAGSNDADHPFKDSPRIAIWRVISNYHRHRVARLVSYDQEAVFDEHGEFTFERFRGAMTDNLVG